MMMVGRKSLFPLEGNNWTPEQVKEAKEELLASNLLRFVPGFRLSVPLSRDKLRTFEDLIEVRREESRLDPVMMRKLVNGV